MAGTIDFGITSENNSKSGNVLLNDGGGSKRTVTAMGGSNSTATPGTSKNGAKIGWKADGTYTYDPSGAPKLQALDDRESVLDTFTYTLKGSSGKSETITAVILVTGVNDLPVAKADTYTLSEDGSLTTVLTKVNATDQVGVLGNDTDVDVEPLNAILVSGPTNASSFTLNPDGTFTYTPNANTNGPDSFTYKVNDGSVDGNTVTVTLNVTPVNDIPTATNDAYSVDEDGTLPIAAATGVLANDSDLDKDALNATVLTTVQHGTLTLNADGSFTYAPTGNYNGKDSFSYTVSDGKGGFATAKVNLTIDAVNDAPVPVTASFSTSEDTSVSGTLSATDDDNDGLTFVLKPGGEATNGTVTILADGSYTYTPNGNYNGPDTFTYTVTDGKSAPVEKIVAVTVTPVEDPQLVNFTQTRNELAEDADPTAVATLLITDTDTTPAYEAVTFHKVPSGIFAYDATTKEITFTPKANFAGPVSAKVFVDGVEKGTIDFTVTASDDAPVAVADTTFLAEDAAETAIDVLANDSDFDDGPKEVKAVTQGEHGTVTFTSSGVSYTPEENYFGLDTFTYTLNGGSTATVTVDVNAADDAPVAVDDTATVAEDAIATPIAVLANDTDIDEGTKQVIAVGTATNGTATLENGTVTYKPNENFSGTDTFTYKVNGGSEATVTVTVTPSDDAPVAVTDAVTVAEDADTIMIDVLRNDTDIDGGLKRALIGTAAANGTATVQANGTIAYKPNENFFGTDTFTYKLNGGSEATVTVTVNPVNDAPVISEPFGGNSYGTSVSENFAGVITTIRATDPDQGDAPPTYSVDETTWDGAFFAIDPTTGELRFKVAPDFENPLDADKKNFYTVNVIAADIHGAQDTQLISVNVNDLTENTAPVANDDAAVTFQNKPVSIDVLANDSDAETADADLAVTIGTVNNGTAVFNTATRQIDYTPLTGFLGDTTFTYTLSDGEKQDTATVRVTVKTNEPPNFTATGGETQDEKLFVPENTAGTITTLAATDPEGGAVTYSIGANPNDSFDNGSFTIDQTSGALKFTNPPDFEFNDNGGDDLYKVRVTATDADGASSFRDVWVQVTDVADGVLRTLSPVGQSTGYIMNFSQANVVDTRIPDQPQSWNDTIFARSEVQSFGATRFDYQGNVVYNLSGITSVQDAALNLYGHSYTIKNGSFVPGQSLSFNIYAHTVTESVVGTNDWMTSTSGWQLVGSGTMPSLYDANGNYSGEKPVDVDLNETVINQLLQAGSLIEFTVTVPTIAANNHAGGDLQEVQFFTNGPNSGLELLI